MDLEVRARGEKGIIQGNPEVTLDKLGLTKNGSFRYYSVNCIGFRISVSRCHGISSAAAPVLVQSVKKLSISRYTSTVGMGSLLIDAKLVDDSLSLCFMGHETVFGILRAGVKVAGQIESKNIGKSNGGVKYLFYVSDSNQYITYLE